MTTFAAALLALAGLAHGQTIAWDAAAKPLFSGALTPLPVRTRAEPPERTEYPESVSRPPRSDVNPRRQVTSRACQSREEGYSVCYEGDDPEIDLFSFTNDGGNAVVPGRYDPSRGFPQRWFAFHYSAQARQDVYFAVSDMPSERLSQTQESYFMLFPRKVLPSIRARDGQYIVTLPTGELVAFDAKTREILGGVLTEDGELRLGVSPRVAYRGTGVMIRADRAGEDPRIKTTATITRGKTACKVPAAELWDQGGYVHFKFPTDEGFDAFLRARCRFGI